MFCCAGGNISSTDQDTASTERETDASDVTVKPTVGSYIYTSQNSVYEHFHWKNLCKWKAE